MGHERSLRQQEDQIQDLASTLVGLRWSLTSLRMSGIKEFSFINSFQGTKIAQEREDPEHNSGGHRLAEVLKELSACTRCRLSSERNKLVFGEGNPDAPLVFVGEGPGMEEDKQGRPFVGKAGKLLDRMIAAIGIQRQEVYICNVVKCRPPGNRTPNLDEVEVCAPFLIRQIEAIRPRAVCTLGACASQTLLGNSSPISRLRGKVHSWRGLSLVCTYHPAYLLRNPVQKAAVWQDLLLVQQLLKSQLVKTL